MTKSNIREIAFEAKYAYQYAETAGRNVLLVIHHESGEVHPQFESSPVVEKIKSGYFGDGVFSIYQAHRDGGYSHLKTMRGL